ncbi:twin-arginine translocase TatA/TatE family subunit [Myroides ceti]|uniref:Twin-arginine translocase TatA/TatE family subunit n=1 Tax=Paenimyroides ceti TaxID=395087 RepID=A0ABT8CZ02_9FLAO|nr:twin-arginine translocase TatA/TatE family subunit [Paenimyroides ceti]MDN3708415.1 twin-arginine translocase TatA/TatE family subunit [Paenimyroides ceti]
MFGIGMGEFVFIMVVVLMLFGSDKIPDIARGLAKGLAQIKNATNDIKHEITKSVEESGVIKDIQETVNVDEIKKSVGYDELKESMNIDRFNPLNDVQNEIDKAKEDIESISGPVKRQR